MASKELPTIMRTKPLVIPMRAHHINMHTLERSPLSLVALMMMKKRTKLKLKVSNKHLQTVS